MAQRLLALVPSVVHAARPDLPVPFNSHVASFHAEVRDILTTHYPSYLREYYEYYPAHPYLLDAAIPSKRVAIVGSTVSHYAR